MATIVRLPKLGLSDRGEIVEWTVSQGDTVQEGDGIAILESEKSAVDIEATASGVFLTAYVDQGEEIEIEPGRPVAAIGEDGEPPPSLDETEAATGSTASAATDAEPGAAETPPPLPNEVKATPKARVRAHEAEIDVETVSGTGPEGSITSADVEAAADNGTADVAGSDARTAAQSAGTDSTDRPAATPKAKRAAQERDVDLAAVTGTGPDGAVTERDVDRHLGELDVPAQPSADATTPDTDAYAVTEVRERSRLERTVADRLSRSAREIPHVRGDRTVNVERLESFAETHAGKDGATPSVNDLLFLAVVRTLQDHPEFNAIFAEGEHRLVADINVGYAVDSEDGLVVPVVEECGEKSLAALTAARRGAVERVLEGAAEPADLRGGTFTVTNVGALGIDASFSLINPPQVAILAVGRRKPSLFDAEGETVTAPGVTLSLLVDHRVLDGGDAGAFLSTMAEYVERPALLL